MAKLATKYICQECGTWHGKWSGKCEGCGEWNKLVEEVVDHMPKAKSTVTRALELSPINTPVVLPQRVLSHVVEFDRVCGGGLVPGSVILLGGDPGIGKSTLLLQVTAKLAFDHTCFYISGEEGLDQIRLRARRMNLTNSPLILSSSTSTDDIIQAIRGVKDLRVVVIDSIQTMGVGHIESAPGSVAQVRASAHEIIKAAKECNITTILVGHVTKEGSLAGPKVLEHMVDTVLYFEGEKHYPYRILRSIKNRFGPTYEIGVFNMSESGLEEVSNPSSLFLNDHDEMEPGVSIYAGLEGTRPVLCEVQALIAPTYLPSPRRASVGFDSSRLAMLLAVLDARCGVSLGNKDVYVNVAGGMKISETAADLALVAALLSAHFKTPCPKNTIYFGEVGLGGEVRRVQHPSLRHNEAKKLGFKQSFCAKEKAHGEREEGIHLQTLSHINELIQTFRGYP